MGSKENSPETREKKMAFNLGLSDRGGVSPRTRSVSNEIKRAAAYAAVEMGQGQHKRVPSLHASMDTGAMRGQMDDAEEDGLIGVMNAVDRDRTMRPPSRRPIPSLPTSHRFSP